MGQKIGNIGELNMIQATEESIQQIERINNVGSVICTPKTVKLLSQMKIENIGSTIVVEEDWQLIKGLFILDDHYIESASEHSVVFIQGVLLVDNEISVDSLQKCQTEFVVMGAVYTPKHIKGAVQTKIKKITGGIIEFDGKQPFIQSGKIELDEGFLQSLELDENILVNGTLTLSNNVDIDTFYSKINRLDVNGVLFLTKEQQSILGKKITVNGKTVIIPTGYQKIDSKLQLHNRSIKRFKQAAIYTKKPILLAENITREQFQQAFRSIHSLSFIICHESIEDLVYEALDSFETEVFSYQEHYRFIEKENWTKREVELLEPNTTIIVNGQWSIEEEFDEELLNKNIVIELKGTIYTPNESMKHYVQKNIQTQNGSVYSHLKQEDQYDLDNIGELLI
ncbi:hypothetical protein [Alkalihalobacillus trypoxylicola]|uniref:Uncharacterized protein n=1 Tax=Alkalihalobacillus trypoxylicola TaxID=519424 RepID=A0A162DPN1_9BACI|nr:hypothetical protein [Alkalihalobacillus trypoxylicola]KYG30490.1 hypothetical protein AZF04_19595 [Alkalihalobacillus trypoxylicola]